MDILEKGNIDEIMEQIAGILEANKEPYASFNCTYEIQLLDEKLSYQLQFHNGVATVMNDLVDKPDCVLKMESKLFRKFLNGNLNSMTAFMTGKLKVDGNIGLALKLEKLLKEYQF
ncbi:SCP2 sterol-binding domain-containing protein [Ornithinibacillus xuwenensis]|uniref:SCP2 sterol-binding domain-containing protein n=1 Tax=Ornithinibacillus xuwenensis TaxID=3144668 RepID=A0ABU9XHX9_9BACI